MIPWHRFYDPSTGRYISTDPIGLEGGMNLYAYVGGDPINATDPTELVCGTGACVGTYAVGTAIVSAAIWMQSDDGKEAISNAVEGVSDAIDNVRDKALERKKYKRRCRERAPNGLDPCDDAKWKLQRAKDCISGYIAIRTSPPVFELFQQDAFKTYNMAGSIFAILLGFYLLVDGRIFIKSGLVNCIKKVKEGENTIVQ